MAYGTTEGVAARVPSLRIGQAAAPDEVQVLQWLGEGTAWIDRTLAASGYTVPVLAVNAPTLHVELVAIAEQYAAAQALRARGLDSLTGASEERSTILMREVTQRLAGLAQQDLTYMGAIVQVSANRANRRLRSVQIRRIDGYSRGAEVGYGEYSGVLPPSD